MEEQLIKTAREKGFQGLFEKEWIYNSNEPLRYYFWLCELQKWLREKYSIECIVNYTSYALQEFPYDLEIYKDNDSLINADCELYDMAFGTYELALEIGLQYSLALIK